MCLQLVKYCCPMKVRAPGTAMATRASCPPPRQGHTCSVSEIHSSVIIPPNHTGSGYHYFILRQTEGATALTRYLSAISKNGSQFPTRHKQEIKQEVANSNQSPNTCIHSFWCRLRRPNCMSCAAVRVVKVCFLLWVYSCGRACSTRGHALL